MYVCEITVVSEPRCPATRTITKYIDIFYDRASAVLSMSSVVLADT